MRQSMSHQPMGSSTGRPEWLRGLLLALCLVLAPVATADFLLVHLPNSPVETASRRAEALTTLAARLGEAVPELSLEAKIFRRAGDARAFLEAENDAVLLLLSAPAFLLDLPSDGSLEPSFRFVQSGEATARRLLVSRTEGDLDSLAALQGRSLSIVEEAPSRGLDYLAAAVFEGQLDPGTWFGQVTTAVDDFAATADVLYGNTDGALVSQSNPLLQRHLASGDLRVLYESPPLSLPIVSVRRDSFDAAQLRSLEQALVGYAETEVGRTTLATLGGDGFVALSASQSQALRRLPERASKTFEIALPQRAPTALTSEDLPPGDTLPFLLSIELPDPPLDPDALPEPPPR